MLNTPLQMMLVALAGWVNEQQLAVIEYLKEENRVLREQVGRRRLTRGRILARAARNASPPGRLPGTAGEGPWAVRPNSHPPPVALIARLRPRRRRRSPRQLPRPAGNTGKPLFSAAAAGPIHPMSIF